MNKVSQILIAALLSCGLAACAGPNGSINQQTVGTIAGGVAGGILGATVFHGDSKAFGAVGGAIIGSMLGSAVGKSMDDQDRINAQQAMIHTPVGQEAHWQSRRGVSYTVRPVGTYHRGNRYCRRAWIMTRDMQGRRQRVKTLICRRPGGRWHLVN